MKLRLITALSLSVLSINAFAYSGNGYTIVSETEKHTGVIDYGLTSDDKGLKKNTFATAVAEAWAYNASGKVRESIRIDGSHRVAMVNNTNHVQRYTYKYAIYCYPASVEFEKTIDIEPGGNFEDHGSTFAIVQQAFARDYAIRAETAITGAENLIDSKFSTLTVTWK